MGGAPLGHNGRAGVRSPGKGGKGIAVAKRIGAGWLLGAVGLLLLTGCAGKKMTLEISGKVMYEKPRIESVSYTVSDQRPDGGVYLVDITMVGDSGLAATFDITPDMADGLPMGEGPDGTYTARYAFPASVVGGPYTVTGRLSHPDAGDVVRQDPRSLTVPLPSRRR